MALDKVIINHLDEMDKINMEIEAIIDNLIDNINIDELVNDPALTLTTIGAVIEETMDEDVYMKAFENGVEFAKAIEDDGDIKVQDTNDPNLNEGKLYESNG